jgi:hypothetical protein
MWQIGYCAHFVVPCSRHVEDTSSAYTVLYTDMCQPLSPLMVAGHGMLALQPIIGSPWQSIR